jgi:hypothetical protein
MQLGAAGRRCDVQMAVGLLSSSARRPILNLEFIFYVLRFIEYMFS